MWTSPRRNANRCLVSDPRIHNLLNRRETVRHRAVKCRADDIRADSRGIAGIITDGQRGRLTGGGMEGHRRFPPRYASLHQHHIVGSGCVRHPGLGYCGSGKTDSFDGIAVRVFEPPDTEVTSVVCHAPVPTFTLLRSVVPVSVIN